MTLIVRRADEFLIGSDLVDATTGAYQSHGEWSYSIRPYGDKRCTWKSTLPISESEHILRTAAAKEHKRVTFIKSQSI